MEFGSSFLTLLHRQWEDPPIVPEFVLTVAGVRPLSDGDGLVQAHSQTLPEEFMALVRHLPCQHSPNPKLGRNCPLVFMEDEPPPIFEIVKDFFDERVPPVTDPPDLSSGLLLLLLEDANGKALGVTGEPSFTLRRKDGFRFGAKCGKARPGPFEFKADCPAVEELGAVSISPIGIGEYTVERVIASDFRLATEVNLTITGGRPTVQRVRLDPKKSKK